MVDAQTFAPNMNLGQVASVAGLYADRPYKEAQMRAQQQQELMQGLDMFGKGVQTLVDRRNAMAQALAAAKVYGTTPEGQAILNPTTTSSTEQVPVMRNQTAAFNPDTGTVTPNTGLGGVGTTTPQTTTTVKPPAIDLPTLQTMMMGEKPSDVMTQQFERQKEREQIAAEKEKQAFTEKIEPQKLATQTALNQILAGFKGIEAQTGASRASSEDVNTLLQRRQEASANLSTGWFNGINNQKAEQAKKDIADIDAQLAAKGYKGPLPATGTMGNFNLPDIGQTVMHPSGVSIKRTQ